MTHPHYNMIITYTTQYLLRTALLQRCVSTPLEGGTFMFDILLLQKFEKFHQYFSLHFPQNMGTPKICRNKKQSGWA